MKNIYDALGIKKDTAKSIIKKMYRAFVKENHPDAGGDAADFVEKQQYFEILLDDSKRAKYDETGNTEPNNDNQKIITHLVLVFTKIIATDPDDIKAELQNIKEHGIDTGTERIEEKKAQIKSYKEFKQRVINKKSPLNYLMVYLNDQISGLENQVKTIEDELSFFIKAFEYINEHLDFKKKSEINPEITFDFGDFDLGDLSGDLNAGFPLGTAK